MPIQFSDARWERAVSRYECFWSGKTDRPLAHVTLTGADPGRPEPDVPPLTMATVHDFSYTAEQLIDRLDYDLCCNRYLADGFPMINFGMYGPGVVAAFLGARLDNSTGNVWFHPPQGEIDVRRLHFAYDPGNKWLQRIRSLYIEGTRRWQGQVALGMTDLGGVMDILASFLTTEGLLVCMIEEPDEIKRLVAELAALWRLYYSELSELIPNPRGYVEWGCMLSRQPSFMLQSDFSYMIGPEQFREFVLPELEETCAFLPRSFYHLDGVGQLNHLDMLLSIERLAGIQWVPGVGKPPAGEWPAVLQKIRGAGKLVEIIDFGSLPHAVEALGGGAGLHAVGVYPASKEAEARRILDSCGVECVA
jgi:5-methyltetrahydrofolate--homocysteine methyltransferase